MRIVISTDNEKLDIDFIHHFLTHLYWGKGKTKKDVNISMKNCLNFGIYLNKKQMDFTRILTDYTVFGYLMNVFIIEEHRGNGYLKLMMKAVTDHPDVQNIKRWMLATSDAHTLYHQFGFNTIEDPSKLMEKLTNN